MLLTCSLYIALIREHVRLNSLCDATGLVKDLLHDLPVKEVRIDAVAQVVKKTRQNEALVLLLGEWYRFLRTKLL